jgi:hypothetical protein
VDCSFLEQFALLRTDLSRRQQGPSRLIQIPQRKQRHQLRRVLRKPAIPHLRITELPLEYPATITGLGIDGLDHHEQARPGNDDFHLSQKLLASGLLGSKTCRIFFDKCYRAPGNKAGEAGLGLYLVKWIIELHGGTVSAQSVPEQGTTIVIRLPLAM